MTRAWLVTLAFTASCSWIAVPPHTEVPHSEPCPHAALIADTTGAVIAFTSSAAGVVTSVVGFENHGIDLAVGGAGVALWGAIIGTVYTFAARHGWRAREECKHPPPPDPDDDHY